MLTLGDCILDAFISEHIGDFVLSFFIVVIDSLSLTVHLVTWWHRCEAKCHVIRVVHAT